VSIVMDRYSPYGIVCTQCNASLIAPHWSEYVSKDEVRHSWCCENCGHRIVTAVTYVRLLATAPQS